MKEHLYLYKSGRVIIWHYDFSNEYTREMIFRLGVPAGRKTVISHGWDAAFHVSPSGKKMRLVLDELERLGATGEADCVFIE